MAQTTGTFNIDSLLAVKIQSAAQFGMDTIQRVLQADLAAHNLLVREMVSELCAPTTDRQRIYGASGDGEMTDVDEFGRAPTQKVIPGTTVGFPMEMKQFALGWTRKYLQMATPADLAIRALNAEKAHWRAIQKAIKKALFLSSNFTFQDYLVDRIDLPVKRLVNADGSPIPNGPNSETWDGASHTHYSAAASLVAANVLSTIDTVVEHGYGGSVKLYIARGNESSFKTVMKAAGSFEAYQDPRMIFPSSPTTGIPAQRLDITRLDNRAVGIAGAAEVWVKPWIPSGYMFVFDASSPDKPLCFRQRDSEVLQGLRIAAEIETFPLQAQYMEDEFGVGVWTRTNGAIHQFTNATYQDPTIS